MFFPAYHSLIASQPIYIWIFAFRIVSRLMIHRFREIIRKSGQLGRGTSMVRNPFRLPALDDRDTGCQFLSERLRDRSGQAKGLNQILRWLGMVINPEVIALARSQQALAVQMELSEISMQPASAQMISYCKHNSRILLIAQVQ